MNVNEVHFLHTYSLGSRMKVLIVYNEIKYLDTADLSHCNVFSLRCKTVIYCVSYWTAPSSRGHVVAQLVEALHYKPEVHRFDSRWFTGIFHCHNPSGRIMTLRSTQSLTEMSTGNISWRVKVAGV